MAFTYSTEDKRQLNEKGISEEKINEQLHYFEQGFPALHIQKPASHDRGILQVNENEQSDYIALWEQSLKTNKVVTKFVPASGAASRMFKDIFTFLENEADAPTGEFEKQFFDNIRSFAFYDLLNQACQSAYNKSIDELMADNRYKDVVKMLLHEDGLNYGELPKGLLLLHSYADKKRTPMEEHLIEGAMYAKDANGNVNVHFTISPHHEALFQKLVKAVKTDLEKQMDAHFNVTFSIQKPSTDTIAVDLENKPFRDEGKLLFRPGGHGALIENLNDLESDIVFVKNIDNIVPDKYKEDESTYKKMLAGVLVDAQKKAFDYLAKLESGKYSKEEFNEIKNFIEDDLCITNETITDNDEKSMVAYMIKKLNRPIRVCGMVRNDGEPGGGPFIVENKDGSFSPHILEGSQIVTDEAKEIASQATHFNPVDLVCGLKDRHGKRFNLLNYIDKDTGFISSKSQSGRALKALELPGLWNGAMSDWNTIFVEVPISTFNPVKTVNDLLRPEHQ